MDKELQRRNRELHILNEIARSLNHEVELSQMLRNTLAQVTELFDLKTGWIWLADERTTDFYLAVVQNLPSGLANTPGLMDGSAYCHCIDSYKSDDMDGAANVNIIDCTRLRKLKEGTEGLRYHASIPLYAQEKKLGVMNVAGQGWEELSEDDLRLLHTVGDLLSIAIERTRLFKRSAELGAVEERNRLAREIHDTVAQGLTATTLQLETVDALLENNQADRARDIIQQALAQTRNNLEEVRRSVLDLRAAPLEGRMLVDALEDLINTQATQYHLNIQYQVNERRSLPTYIEVGLYRITQEAINNIIKHADAKNVEITLTASPDKIELVVRDDGTGCDVSRIGEGRYGLIGLNERANLMGGTLDFKSAIGNGTRLTVNVPLRQINE